MRRNSAPLVYYTLPFHSPQVSDVGAFLSELVANPQVLAMAQKDRVTADGAVLSTLANRMAVDAPRAPFNSSRYP